MSMSSNQRRAATAASAHTTPSGAGRIMLDVYTYPDGTVWFGSPDNPDMRWSRSNHKAAVQDFELMLHQMWRDAAARAA